MRSPEFRFYYFTARYDETIAFYRDVLGLAVYTSWDRGDDRGTIFRSPNGVGFIEIEAGGDVPSLAGGFYVEVADLEVRYERVRAAGAPIRKELGVTSYGHRNFKTVDPNGIEIAFFEYVERPPHADAE
ncbi:MAG TPA: VOC family protein [Thermoanaerobaculia bacterium]|jgi:catechol 2,3-dioxygenase-like lactoylglutathione lyase family enzyme|nr:VOC family protein [Thermoanaerobaculia bacterium]